MIHYTIILNQKMVYSIEYLWLWDLLKKRFSTAINLLH
jgi:hypothetical protein